MSGTDQAIELPRPAGAHPAPSAFRSTWGLSWHGVRTVAVLDLRQRVRSTRWIIALVVWFVLIGGLTWLTWIGANSAFADPAQTAVLVGPTIFGFVVFFVLFLGLLVAPTLSATSINGDRAAGTLATLQVTLLTPAEIAVGKLGAAWVAALAFLATAVPFLIVSLTAGGTSVLAMIVCLLVVATMLAIVCAIGLGFSALVGRASGSAVLTYLTVAGLSVLSPILFALTFPSITSDEPVRVWATPASYTWDGAKPPVCEWRTEMLTQAHTERTWWLLAMNPFVIVADAAPDATQPEHAGSLDPLGGIRSAVRSARTGPAGEQDWCTQSVAQLGGPTTVSPVSTVEPDRSVVWPWGLAANVLLGAGGLVVAVRRLSIPQRTLPRGTRVA